MPWFINMRGPVRHKQTPVDTEQAETCQKREGRTANDWIEIISAVLLALATIASAWNAYQSARWGGVQATDFAEAGAARTESAKASTRAGQQTLIDISMFLDFLNAYSTGDTRLYEYIYTNFRDEMKVAVDAWLALKPAENPEAPRTPFEMDAYKNDMEEESDRLEDEAEAKSQDARDANQQSDNYILLTVVFASVLFFAGVSSKFANRTIKIAVLSLGVGIFIAAVFIMSAQPIH